MRLVYRSSVLATTPLRIDTRPATAVRPARRQRHHAVRGRHALLTTISPNGDGFREQANISFRLREPATVTMDVTRTVKAPQVVLHADRAVRPRACTRSPGQPRRDLNPRTYLVRLTAVDRTGNRIVYGAPNAFVGRRPRGVVVRIQGIDAGFAKPNYAAGRASRRSTSRPMSRRSRYASSSPGPEKVVTYADNQFAGVEVDAGADADRLVGLAQTTPHTITFRVPDLPSGLYYVAVHRGRRARRLRAVRRATGRARRDEPRARRPADEHLAGVQLPGRRTATATATRGTPGRRTARSTSAARTSRAACRRASTATTCRSCTGCTGPARRAEFISDSDFDPIATGDQLARALRPDRLRRPRGVRALRTSTTSSQRFRDLGGNLMFLSANNFFWKVAEVAGQMLRKIGEWRDAGRPEAALIGVAVPRERRRPAPGPLHRPEHRGRRRGSGTAPGSPTARRSASSSAATGSRSTRPRRSHRPGRSCVAQIPDLLGPGLTAQMCYYETPAGAKVFAAGTLDFGGSATFWPVKRMLDNLWARLSQP